MNEKIKIIQEWMEENAMEVNPSECEIIIISNNNQENNEPIYFNGEEIPKVYK